MPEFAQAHHGVFIEFAFVVRPDHGAFGSGAHTHESAAIAVDLSGSEVLQGACSIRKTGSQVRRSGRCVGSRLAPRSAKREGGWALRAILLKIELSRNGTAA